MTPEELKKATEEVADTLYDLIKMGIVETHDIDEDGNFTYRLTKAGKELGKELIKLGIVDDPSATVDPTEDQRLFRHEDGYKEMEDKDE